MSRAWQILEAATRSVLQKSVLKNFTIFSKLANVFNVASLDTFVNENIDLFIKNHNTEKGEAGLHTLKTVSSKKLWITKDPLKCFILLDSLFKKKKLQEL